MTKKNVVRSLILLQTEMAIPGWLASERSGNANSTQN